MIFKQPDDPNIHNIILFGWTGADERELGQLLIQGSSDSHSDKTDDEIASEINQLLVTHEFDNTFDYNSLFPIIMECTTDLFRQKRVLNACHQFLDFISANRSSDFSYQSFPRYIHDNLFFIAAYAYERAINGSGTMTVICLVIQQMIYNRHDGKKYDFDGLNAYLVEQIHANNELYLDDYPYWLDVFGKGNGRENTFVDDFIAKIAKYDPNTTNITYSADEFIEIINYLTVMDKKDIITKMCKAIDVCDLLRDLGPRCIYFGQSLHHHLTRQSSYGEDVLASCMSDVFEKQSQIRFR